MKMVECKKLHKTVYPNKELEVYLLQWVESSRRYIYDARNPSAYVPGEVYWVDFVSPIDGSSVESLFGFCFQANNIMVLQGEYTEAEIDEMDRGVYALVTERATPEQIEGYFSI